VGVAMPLHLEFCRRHLTHAELSSSAVQPGGDSPATPPVPAPVPLELPNQLPLIYLTLVSHSPSEQKKCA